MATEFVSSPKVGDLVKMEYDQRYSRELMEISLDGEPEGLQTVLGRVVDVSGEEIAAEGEGDAHAVVVTDTPVEDGASVNVIVRGPVLLNRGQLRLVDGTDAAAVVAALHERGIVTIPEAAVVEVQES